MKSITPEGKETELTQKQTILQIWKDVTEKKTLSPLLQAIGQALADAPDNDQTFEAAHHLGRFANRIASSDRKVHCDISAMGYHNDYKGEWHVTNSDLELFSHVGMWVHRQMETGWSWLQGIEGGLKMKRLQQAYDRYQKTGLRAEHCKLLENMLWDIDVMRGDWISLHVQGKRPLGNSSIVYDIYENVGWDTKFDEDEGPNEEQRETAWDLFDELVFAAPDAARLALRAVLV